jgi:nucleoside-diphosphate-sugar epimerase
VAAIAITGATGFLGGAICRRLLAQGQPVVALGRDQGKLAALEALGAHTVRNDLAGGPPREAGELSAVVHCAALSSAWGPRAAFHASNVGGTFSALRFARAAGAKRFVHISTPSLYFRFQDQPGVKEDVPLPTPVNAYAATKGEAERIVRAETGLDPVILRPRGIYGAGDTALLPRLLRAAQAGPLPLIRGGRAETDLTHVDDVVSAVLAALSAPAGMTQCIFNISGGEPLPVRQIADSAALHAGLTVRWRPMPAGIVLAAARALEAAAYLHPERPEPRITAYGAGLFAFTQTLDLAAARQQLGWAPRIGFEEGLTLTFGRRP